MEGKNNKGVHQEYVESVSRDAFNYRRKDGPKGEEVMVLLDVAIDFSKALYLGGLLDAFVEKNDRDLIIDMGEVKEVDQTTWSILGVIRMNQEKKGQSFLVINFDLPVVVKKEWEIED